MGLRSYIPRFLKAFADPGIGNKNEEYKGHRSPGASCLRLRRGQVLLMGLLVLSCIFLMTTNNIPHDKELKETREVQGGWATSLKGGGGVDAIMGERRRAAVQEGPKKVDHAAKNATIRQKSPETKELPTLYSFRVEALEKARMEWRNGGRAKPEVRELPRLAEESLKKSPMSVMNKTTIPPSGDKHDYYHTQPYWWIADCAKVDERRPSTCALNCTYHSKDGRRRVVEVNGRKTCYSRFDGQRSPGTIFEGPKSEMYDRTAWFHTCANITALGLAWSVTGEKRYSDHGARMVRSWFLDESTRMNPHWTYSQFSGMRSRSGLIEGKDLYFLLDAISLVGAAGSLNATEMAKMRRWCTELLTWLETDKLAHSELLAVNNHGSYYELQYLALLLFLNNSTDPRLSRSFERTTRRLRAQFTVDGTAPHELTRQTTLHYSHFSLLAWLHYAEMAKIANLGNLFDVKFARCDVNSLMPELELMPFHNVCWKGHQHANKAQCDGKRWKRLREEPGIAVCKKSPISNATAMEMHAVQNIPCCVEEEPQPVLQKAMQWLLGFGPQGNQTVASLVTMTVGANAGMGVGWPYPMIDPFDHVRILPIAESYRRHCGRKTVWDRGLPCDVQIPMHLTVHSGVRPFWGVDHNVCDREVA